MITDISSIQLKFLFKLICIMYIYTMKTEAQIISA